MRGLVECDVGCWLASLSGFAISRAKHFVLHGFVLGSPIYVSLNYRLNARIAR